MTPNDASEANPKPSLSRLNRAALLALGAASVIVATVVLPAEYGIDVTGAGRLLGLTQMGQMKAAQQGGSAPAGPVAGDSVTSTPDGKKRVQIVLGPYGGREVKAVMTAGAEMTYEWSTDGQAVEFEFHGDPDNPKTPGEYTSYEKGNKANASGSFKAAFTGRHGWFWKNLGSKPVIITATVKGAVEKFTPLYAEGEAPAVAAAATGQGSTDTTAYYVDLPMKRLMNEVFGHSAQQIWDRQGYISDEKGFRSLFPKNAEEWKKVENGALSLAELTNVLMLPGRRVEDKAWADSVTRLRTTALKIADLTRKKNEDAFMEAGVELNEACYSCHKKFAPGVE